MRCFVSDCNLVFPASVINGVAVSKTFQILYRNEDVAVNDVVFFKVHTLVEANKVRYYFLDLFRILLHQECMEAYVTAKSYS